MRIRMLLTILLVSAIVSPAMAISDGIGLYMDGLWTLSDDVATPAADHTVLFGGIGWKPVVGDWNGDGVDGLGVFNPITGVWQFSQSATSPSVDFTTTFGGTMDPMNAYQVPFAGDWDGDGTVGIAVFDFQSGLWLFSNSIATPAVNYSYPAGGGQVWYGITGDWNGDGKDGMGIYYQAGGGTYLNNNAEAWSLDLAVAFGGNGWDIVMGDWNGDGVDSFGIYCTPGGPNGPGYDNVWYLANSVSAPVLGEIGFVWGSGGKPVSGVWIPEPTTIALLGLGVTLIRRRKL